MKNEVIRLQGISKRFDENHVLKSIDLGVPKGMIMGLVGKNGAGKSTMIKCMLGLLKPDSGEASIFGEPCWNLSAEVKHRIGYVPQNMASFGWLTVEDMLAYTAAFYSRWNKKLVNGLIKDWELDRYAKIMNLSEGERQKLAIIQAMGHEPDLFIFDEPVASLDPVARRKFIKQLIQLNINEGKTMLFSTHITSDLERAAADVALLKDGEICFNGDLSMLKDQVYRLRIQSRVDLPEQLPIDKMISASVNGNTAVVTVNGLDEQRIPDIEKEMAAVIDIEHLNLEEIFLELEK